MAASAKPSTLRRCRRPGSPGIRQPHDVRKAAVRLPPDGPWQDPFRTGNCRLRTVVVTTVVVRSFVVPTIEEEINQAPFPSPRQRASVNILFTATRLEAQV